MPFVLLGLAIVSEVFATLSLRASEGFSKLVPSVVVVVGYGISFVLLAQVLKSLSVSVVYAVWSGTGTALIAAVGLIFLGEPARWNVVAGIVFVIGGVVLLNLHGATH
jgi:small multidrug resistance pump